MPCFLFIVGASISLSILPLRAKGVTRWELFKKAAVRTFKLFALGIFLQGADFPNYDLSMLRLPGVLQRIAFDYFVVTCCVIFMPVWDAQFLQNNKYLNATVSVFVKYIAYWVTAISIFIVFISMTFGVRIPDCNNKRGQITPACNAAGIIDKAILTTAHMYQTPTCLDAVPPCKFFDPEGILSTVGSTASCFFGLYFGFILYVHKSHKIRLAHWIPFSAILFVLGIAIHFAGIPLNKNLYSMSYIFLMAGTAGILLSICYILIDIPESRWFEYSFMPFIVLGMNSIAIYAGDEFLPYIIGKRNGDGFIYWGGNPTNNPANWFYSNILLYGRNVELANFFYALIDVTFWVIVAAIMYRKKIFVKI
jgi:heparan-alpha-glucosaminide N-acetyltransferase